MKRALFVAFFLVLAAIQSSSAQTPTAADILHNMKKQFETVKDYTAQLKVTVDMERMQIPEMLVKIYFKQPDKIHIEAKNFAMVPREIAGMNPAQFIDKFDATVVETGKKESVPGVQITAPLETGKGEACPRKLHLGGWSEVGCDAL